MALISQHCIPGLVEMLTRPEEADQESAAYALLHLTAEAGSDAAATRAAIVRAGGLDRLVELVRDSPHKSVRGGALEALNELTVELGSSAVPASIPSLVQLLRGPGEELPARAAHALSVLAYGSRDSCAAIAEAGGIHGLARLLRDAAVDEAVKELAVVTLANCCFDSPDSCRLLQAAGGVALLSGLAAGGSEALKERAAEALDIVEACTGTREQAAATPPDSPAAPECASPAGSGPLPSTLPSCSSPDSPDCASSDCGSPASTPDCCSPITPKGGGSVWDQLRQLEAALPTGVD